MSKRAASALAVLATLAIWIFFSQSLGAATGGSPVVITSGLHQGRPDTHGGLIVWKRYSDTTGWDIYYDNLASPGEQLATNAAGQQINPVTNGADLIWEDWSSGNGDIYMKDVSVPGNPVQPLVTGPGDQAILSVSGNRLVYVNNSDPVVCPPGSPDCPGSGADDVNNDIFMVDLSDPAHTPAPVCTDAGSQWQPRISGTKVVWQDNRNGHWDIYMKDLAAGGPAVQLTSSPGDDTAPDISGNIVVWQRTVGTSSTIWMKDLASGAPEQQVDSSGSYQTSPRITGDLISWQDNRAPAPATWNLYLKDLTSGGPSYPLSPSAWNQVLQSMDGETLVWEEYPNSNVYDDSILMATVPDTTPPVISGLTPANGASPGCAAPLISASYTDNRAGVNPASVSLIVDNHDVTAQATVTASGVTYQPPAGSLGNGSHTATVKVSDRAAAPNTASASWSFSTASPSVGLSVLKVYWAQSTDYPSLLTVRYQLANTSTDFPILGLRVNTSTATNGVSLATPMPVTVGDISPGGSAAFEINYYVPPAVQFFRTVTYVGFSDACGAHYNLPGPPPVS